MAKPRRIVVLAFPGLLLLDLAGPVQVFASVNEGRDHPPYQIDVVAAAPGLIASSSGVAVQAAPLDARALDTLIVPGGPGSRAAARDPAVTTWVAAAAKRARRVCSVCTGAFILGGAGLIDDRRVVTHWNHCDELARWFPRARIEPDAIYLTDGRVWTSAGVTAGIDLALALLEADMGREVAMRVARHMVVFLRRPGGQSQYSQALAAQAAAAPFAKLHDWMAQHLGRDLSVETLAAQAAMSPRTFARRYAQATGLTPAKQVEALRVEAARQALEDEDTPVAVIAQRTGFGDEERMRRAFLRRLGVAPSHYRQRFGAAAPRQSDDRASFRPLLQSVT